MPDDVAGSSGATDPAVPPAAAAGEVPGAIALLSDAPMGTFDESGTYVPRAIVEDDLGGTSLEDAIDATIVEFDDGDIVEGTVVKIDRDEVLLDIGFKSEGVIPVARALHPQRRRPRGDRQPRGAPRGPRPAEGGQGGPARPVQEAGPVRAGLGHDREDQGAPTGS